MTARSQPSLTNRSQIPAAIPTRRPTPVTRATGRTGVLMLCVTSKCLSPRTDRLGTVVHQMRYPAAKAKATPNAQTGSGCLTGRLAATAIAESTASGPVTRRLALLPTPEFDGA